MCDKCDEPNIKALRTALLTLKHGIPKAFVVIIGPVHVARSSLLNYNLLKLVFSILKIKLQLSLIFLIKSKLQTSMWMLSQVIESRASCHSNKMEWRAFETGSGV